MSQKVSSYIVFDFETGGLDCNTNAITELAGIAIEGDGLKEIGRMNRLVSPYYKVYDKKALELTGISMDLLKNEGVELKVVAEEFLQLMEKSVLHNKQNCKTILVGHNVLFDISFLHELLSTIGDSSKLMEKYLDGQKDKWGHYQPRYIDTMNLSKQKWGCVEMKDWKLETCLNKGGVELIDGHRSINDVMGTKELFVEMCLRLRSSGGGEEVSKIRTRDYFRL